MTTKFNEVLQSLISEDFEAYYYHNILSPKFWTGSKFNPEIRKKLITIATDLYKKLDTDAPLLDIQLTGSLANYNYAPYSDLDVHLILDFSEEEDAELARRAFNGERFMWNANHDINFFGHDVEVYVQDVNEQHNSSGLFSLKNNKWIKVPIHDVPEVDAKDVDEQYDRYVSQIDDLVEGFSIAESPEEFKTLRTKAVRMKEKIHGERKKYLKQGGEFCVENLTFKKLRAEGYFDKLMDLDNESYDKEFSEE